MIERLCAVMRSATRPSLLVVIVFLLTAATALGDDMLIKGQPMVEFSLEAHDGTTVSSDDLQGQAYLLYFYPKADTPG